MNFQGVSARSPPPVQKQLESHPRFMKHAQQRDKETAMRLLWINNDGGGFADYVEVTDGMTVEQFFNKNMPGCRPEDYLIRVNRQPVASDYVLQNGDRVTATPTKIEGA